VSSRDNCERHFGQILNSDAWWYKAVALENLGYHPGASTAKAKAASLDPVVKYGSKPLQTITTQQTPSKSFIFF
jgi:hypothetical protein